MHEPRHIAALFCVGWLGCSHGSPRADGGQTWFGTASTDDAAQSSGDDTGGTTSDEEDDGKSGASESGTSSGGTPAGRCDKIDVLFVIEELDNSSVPVVLDDDCGFVHSPELKAWRELVLEYDSHYSKLREGFATLVSELPIDLQVADFQALATGSLVPDPLPYSVQVELPAGQCVSGVVLDVCDQTLGAGRNGYTLDPAAYPDLPGGECMTERYVHSGTTALEKTFSCIDGETTWWPQWYAEAAYSGVGPGTMMDAMMAAVSSTGEAATCNAGFLREDAVLVVVLLEIGADDLADSSRGSTQTWKDALVAAKGGDERIVVLSLVPDDASPFAGELRTFTESFTHGMWGSSSLLDYPTFFAAGTELIDAACDADRGPAPG